MSGRFLVQMTGAPGSGKSAVASAIAAEIGVVVLDSDMVKSAILDADVPWGLAGLRRTASSSRWPRTCCGRAAW